jgi:hypothetical protein
MTNTDYEVNMKVGKKLAAGIESGQETAASAKQTVGMFPLSSLLNFR